MTAEFVLGGESAGQFCSDFNDATILWLHLAADAAAICCQGNGFISEPESQPRVAVIHS